MIQIIYITAVLYNSSEIVSFPWPDVQSLAVFHKNGKRKELPSYQKGRSFQFRYVFLLHTQKFRLLGETFLINAINPQIVPK